MVTKMYLADQVFDVKDFKFTGLKPLGDEPVGTYTIFGKTTKTITLELNTKFVKKIPTDITYPKDLGFNMPEVPIIYIGGCGAKDHHHDGYLSANLIGFGANAHTHMCPNDPIYRAICLGNKDWLTYDGGPSDLMWHEYGHALTPWDCEVIDDLKAPGFHRIDFPSEDYLTDWSGHGPRWQSTMANVLGKPHLTKRTIPFSELKFDIPTFV